MACGQIHGLNLRFQGVGQGGDRVLGFEVDLEYSFGSIEAIGVWPALCMSMFEATLAMCTASVIACQDRLNSWTQVGDFDDLDNLRDPMFDAYLIRQM